MKPRHRVCRGTVGTSEREKVVVVATCKHRRQHPARSSLISERSSLHPVSVVNQVLVNERGSKKRIGYDRDEFRVVATCNELLVRCDARTHPSSYTDMYSRSNRWTSTISLDPTPCSSVAYHLEQQTTFGLRHRPMPPLPKHITILGGGLTGLTAAYRLAKLARNQKLLGNTSQLQISLIEKSERLGGWVHSQKRSIQVPQEIRDRTGAPAEVDVVVEKGPRSIRPKGSVNAAYMLKLVSCIRLVYSPTSLTALNYPKPHTSRSYKTLDCPTRFCLSRTTILQPRTVSS